MSFYKKIRYYFLYRAYLRHISVDLKLMRYRVDYLGRVYTVINIPDEMAKTKRQVLESAEFLYRQHDYDFRERFVQDDDFFTTEVRMLNEQNLLLVHQYAYLDIQTIRDF